MNVAEVLRILKLLSSIIKKRRNENESFNVWMGVPPHILGGVRDCQLWSDKGMSQQDDLEITFCIPKPWGDEEIRTF